MKKILLVEGEADKLFFGSLIAKLKLGNIEVSPPMQLGAAANGKQNAIDLLPSLLKQLEDGTLSRLAIAVDADFKVNGLGHHAALTRIGSALTAAGYKLPNPYPKGSVRYILDHPDGLPSVGFWIMPDCQSEGALEELIAASISPAQTGLFKDARVAVSKITRPLFPDFRQVKAEVCTWLAWQKVPGKGLHSVVGDGLVDFGSGPANQFADWLRHAFN